MSARAELRPFGGHDVADDRPERQQMTCSPSLSAAERDLQRLYVSR
jgi:hypothetical protein